LRGIIEDPRSEVRRLVYADWLEERGDEESLRQAEYLRVECEVDRMSPARNRKRLLKRLNELRERISPEWWRALDWAKTYHCVKFEFRCKQRWDMLTPTEDDNARQCERRVYYAKDDREAQSFADAGECVAVDSRELRLPRLRPRQNESGDFRLEAVS
jgi:uncharacterized protein (TIGR02996 family)